MASLGHAWITSRSVGTGRGGEDPHGDFKTKQNSLHQSQNMSSGIPFRPVTSSGHRCQARGRASLDALRPRGANRALLTRLPSAGETCSQKEKGRLPTRVREVSGDDGVGILS